VNAHACCSMRDCLDEAWKYPDIPGDVGIILTSMAMVWRVMQVEGGESLR